MEQTGKRIRIGLRIAFAFAALALLLAGALIGARFWLTTDGGLSFLASQIDGRRAGPLGVIRLSGLTGDPFTAASVADIALVDDDGVWLRARDARLRWSPFDLISGQLNIATLDVRLIDVQRRPALRTSASSGSGSIGVRIDAIAVEELRIAENVAGPAASYRIAAGGGRSKDGAGFLRLGVSPLDGPEDRVTAIAEWSAGGLVTGTAGASGPAGGVLANLIGAPQGQSVALNAALNGGMDDFSADLRLAFNDTPVVVLTAERDGGVATLTAFIQADQWPLLAEIEERAGPRIDLAGQITFADSGPAILSADISAPSGNLALSGRIDPAKLAFAGPVRIEGRDLDLSRLAPPLTGLASGSGDLVIGDGLSWNGDVAVEAFTFPGGGARRVEGPAEITWAGSTLSWLTPRVAITAGVVSALPDLAATAYNGASRGEVNFASRQVDLIQAQMRSDVADATARGTYAINDGGFDYSGSARLTRLSDIAPLSGSARGQWQVRRVNETAPIRITADLTGQDVGAQAELLGDLLGSSPRISMTAVTRDNRFIVESGRITTPAVDGRMEGRVTDAGVVSGRARLNLLRPVQSGGVDMQSANLVAVLSGSMSAPRVEMSVDDTSLSLAGVDITGIGGTANAVFGRTIEGDADFSGFASGQTLTLSSRIAGDADTVQFPGLKAKLGEFSAAASRLSVSRDGVSGALQASGTLAGLFEVERGDVAANADFSIGQLGPSFRINVDASDVRRGDIRIQAATLSATGSDRTIMATGQLRGLVGALVDFGWSADARALNGSGWSGSITAAGAIDNQPLSTPDPIAWTWSGAEWDVAGAVAGLGGAATLAASSQTGSSQARLIIDDVDLYALTQLARVTPYAGRLSANLTFVNNNSGDASGEVSLSARDANPVGVTTDPATLELSGRLEQGRLSLIASGVGQGFRLEGDGDLRVDVGDGFDIRPSQTAPVSAHLSVDGRVAPLWAVFGPEDQNLRGHVSAKLAVTGTLAEPLVEGDFGMTGGSYDHAETGLRLLAIIAEGSFNSTSARIASLSANDGNGGRLTAEGAITWSGEIDGGLNFDVSNLRALGRDDRSAIVSGKGKVDLQPDAVVIGGSFEVQQARFSVEQPASASIPVLPSVRRVNFPNAPDSSSAPPPATRPVTLDVKVSAPNRIVVFGRGLDMEWGADFAVTGAVANPSINGSARLVRGSLDLAGQRFAFDAGTIDLDGPIRTARINITATRTTADIDARVRLTGTPVDPEFILESTPILPQDEILARILFNRSASELSGLETAQLAAALTQLAGGDAGFDPSALLRDATGLDRVSIGAEGDAATISAGKYVADNVYVQVGAGGAGGAAAQIEWEPIDNVSIISSARENGDSKIALRWKRDY